MKRDLQEIPWDDVATLRQPVEPRATALSPAANEWLLHGAFVNRARTFPTATAVICGDDSISYGDLLVRATELAKSLRASGVESGDLVGLCAERSIEMIVGVFGILLAGGAYVPFDPSYPAERLAYMLEDAQVKLLLTQERLVGLFAASTTQRLLLDEVWPKGCNDPLPEPDVDQLAYVIYTSGSTGRPKGVMITHRSATNTIHDINRRFAIGANDRVFGASSLCFDLSVYDIFGLLAVGGALVIPAGDALREPAYWAEQVTSHRVTIWNSVPAFMEMLTTHALGARRSRLDSLRCVMLSGDWIAVSLPDRIRQMAKNAEVIGLGGATEGAIWSICFRIGKVDPTWKSIPYGRALDNQTMMVLDEAFRPCEVGTVGEIFIGGAGVALGYLNRAELTAERFVPDPAALKPGGKMYRTGDLGRLRADGDIEFLGRIDHQVKISGYRIELGEIETALVRQPQIADAVVVALPSASGGKYLAAYLTTRDGQSLDQPILVTALRQSLPEHMIPSRFIKLDKLPLSANGKVDRGAFSEPTIWPGSSEQDAITTPPSDEIERVLTRMWEECFDVGPIGLQDHFFELGGDSLLATALVARMEHEFSQTFPIGILLERPTIEQLAEWLRSDQRVRESSTLVRLQDGDDRAPLFCVPGIHGSLWEFRRLAALLKLDQTVFGLQPRGLEGREQPDRHIADIAESYVAEVLRAQPTGPYFLAGYSFGGPVVFEMARRLRATGRQVALLAMIDAPIGGHSRAIRLLQRLACAASEYLGPVARLFRSSTDAPLIAEAAGPDGAADEVGELGPGHKQVVHWHRRALDEYKPRPYAGRVTLFRAATAPPWPKRWFKDTTLQWLNYAEGEVHLAPGCHSDLFKRPNIVQLAAKLKDAILRAQ